MKDKIFSVLQRVGRSFMVPIAILPVAGLLLGIGSSFTNATTIETYGLTSLLGNGTILHALLVIMNKVGSAVFDNLPLIFAVGVAIGMAKKEKEVSALSAVIAYFVMNTAINAMLTITGQILENGEIAESVLEGTITSVCGIQSLQMGVFGGIIVGLGVAALHNRFYRIQLPNALSFFGGTRFVPIISTIVYMFVGILMYFVWPVVQNGIYALGGGVGGVPHGLAVHLDDAGVRPFQKIQAAQQSRLAGTRRADDGQRLALLQSERNVLEDVGVPEIFPDAGGFEQCHN